MVLDEVVYEDQENLSMIGKRLFTRMLIVMELLSRFKR